MAQGPESRYRARVHKHIRRGDSFVYVEGMAKAFSQGTPDTYYEGPKGALWIEWKWVKNLPVRAHLNISKLLRPAQLRWLERAHRNGVKCAVIVGSPDGAAYFSDPLAWNGTFTYPKESIPLHTHPAHVARLIERNVGVTDET